MQPDTLLTTPTADVLTTIGPILAALLPWVTGLVTVPLLEWLRNASAWVHSRPTWQTRMLVLAFNGAIAALGAMLGVELPGFTEWTSATVSAVLGGAVATATHAADKAKLTAAAQRATPGN